MNKYHTHLAQHCEETLHKLSKHENTIDIIGNNARHNHRSITKKQHLLLNFFHHNSDCSCSNPSVVRNPSICQTKSDGNKKLHTRESFRLQSPHCQLVPRPHRQGRTNPIRNIDIRRRPRRSSRCPHPQINRPSQSPRMDSG